MIRGDHNPIIAAGLVGLRKLYAKRDVTPLEVLQIYRDRIARLNAGLNIVVALDEAGARAAAAESASRWAAGKPRSAIDGAPVLIKANVAVNGLPWTAALRLYKDRVAAADATVVARLRKAGAVIVGLANMHEAALGATTTSPLYGPCMNPAKAGFTPGGSSGGSAAGVAAGLCAAAIGTDTMGSVRIPSAYCGVVGFKPSAGAISRTGVAPLSFSLDHVGVHGADVADASALYEVARGYDPDDPDSCRVAVGPGKRSLANTRIATLAGVADLDCEPDVLAALDWALSCARQTGADVGEHALPGLSLSQRRMQGLLICEAELLALSGEALLHKQNASPALKGLLAYAHKQSAPKLAGAYAAMAQAKVDARAILDKHDCIVTPTAPQAAFAHTDPAPANQADLTVFANLAGLPAITIPIPGQRGALPLGLQIMAAHGKDAELLGLAAEWEALLKQAA